MSEWTSIIAAIFTILLTAIGGLVLGRLVYMSREIIQDRKDFEKAITDLWGHIRTEQDSCSEMHLQIARDIGDLRARTEGNAANVVSLEARFWEKMRNVSDLANKAKEEVLVRMADIDRKFTDFLIHRNDNHKRG